MLSRRLWRTIASTDIHDPIFRRVSQNQANTPVTRRRFRASRRILLVALLALIGILITSPQLLILLFPHTDSDDHADRILAHPLAHRTRYSLACN